jgi:hypothetical protein
MGKFDSYFDQPEPPVNPAEGAIDDIIAEYESAKKKLPPGFEESNSRNDFIAYAVAYLGRAADKVFRNEREGLNPREFLVKAGGLIISAVVAHDMALARAEHDREADGISKMIEEEKGGDCG